MTELASECSKPYSGNADIEVVCFSFAVDSSSFFFWLSAFSFVPYLGLTPGGSWVSFSEKKNCDSLIAVDFFLPTETLVIWLT